MDETVMRKRLMKKILGFGPNEQRHHVMHRHEWLNRLHPPYYDAQGRFVCPDCSKIPIIARAWVKAHRLIRKYGSVYKQRKFNQRKNHGKKL